MLQRLWQTLRGQGKKLAQAARLWARGQLQVSIGQSSNDASDTFDEALAAFGLCRSDARNDNTPTTQGYCYLWPCNVATWQIWGRLQTQWRTGPMGGRDGLDYTAVIRYLQDVVRLRPRHFKAVFSELQAMEFAAQDEYDKLAAEARAPNQ